MTDRTQPEAVADCIFRLRGLRHVDRHEVAHAMESMVARIADLEAQLEAIGAGGVSGPLIGQPQAMPDLSQLTERGAKAWAGVDAQGLRDGGASPSANAGEPSGHIKEPYTLAEIKAKIASNDYSAEMLLQHAMLLLDSASLSANAGEPVVNRATVIEWLDANDIEVTDRQLGGLFHFSAPPTAQAGGWRLVPVEPTVAQREAMRKGTGMSFSETKIAYAAMLAAAPAPPTSAEGVEHG